MKTSGRKYRGRESSKFYKSQEVETRKRRGGRHRIDKIIFWNVAGIKKKMGDRDFWDYITKYDFISMIETWIDSKGWEIQRDRLPNTHNWKCSYATKIKKKGRARGGIIIGIKKNWRDEGTELIKKKEKGFVWSKISKNGKITNIISVYNTIGWDRMKEILERWLGEIGRDVIIGGDFNIRIGELGDGETEEGGTERKSMDKKKLEQ